MVSNYKKKSNQKKDIVIISGVSIDRTPVIKSFINHYSYMNIVTLEYKHKRRLSFLLNGFRLIMKYKHGQIFFIGIQSLPIIFLTQIFLRKYFYWELETYYISDNKSLVNKMLFFKKLINWTKVNLILPDMLRWDKKDDRTISKKLIIPNVPLTGRIFQRRTLNDKDKINLILYGNLDNNYVYINEWIEFAETEANVFLTLIGHNINQKILESLPINVKYKPQVSHNELLSILKDKVYHFSIVGYRPTDFNHTYCVPNKLYESFSFSLPVIINQCNPTLVNILNETDAGLQINFEEEIASQLDLEIIFNNYDKWVLNAFNAYSTKYNFEYFAKMQLDKIIL